MLYDGWLTKVAKRFQDEFDRIETVYNFEHGDEFEVAICKVLQKLLPRRFAVCRGYLVATDGTRSGDDIIIYDAHNFPTLRALADDLSRKEAIPAEAVLAYIEAKNTLYADDKGGQSLAKATQQVQDAKSVPRERLRHGVLNGVNFVGAGMTVTPPTGYPSHQNPYYGAIWARGVGDGSDQANGDLARRLGQLSSERTFLPDVIAAGRFLAMPFGR